MRGYKLGSHNRHGFKMVNVYHGSGHINVRSYRNVRNHILQSIACILSQNKILTL